MIDSRDVLKARGGVAILTGVGGADMGGVLAGGVYPIVARRTVAGDATVIELSISPRIDVMAILAVVSTSYMVSCFAFGYGSIVARRAGTEHSVMINACDVLKTRSSVAILAGVRAIDMCSIFSCGAYTIVTGRAVPSHSSVIKLSVTPRVGIMAILTCIRTLYVRRGFPLGYSSVMAGAAGA